MQGKGLIKTHVSKKLLLHGLFLSYKLQCSQKSRQNLKLHLF